jgi:hypothetical protein
MPSIQTKTNAHTFLGRVEPVKTQRIEIPSFERVKTFFSRSFLFRRLFAAMSPACLLLLLLLLLWWWALPTYSQAACTVDPIDGLTVCRTDNQLYRGQMLHAQRHGHGHQWTRGEHYQGMWARDKRHGHGVVHYAHGGGYEGAWKHGRMHGTGNQYIAHQSFTMERPVATHWCNHSVLVYRGEFVRGLRHGYGTQWSAESIRSVYRGEWRAGMPHGIARWTYESNHIPLTDGHGEVVKMTNGVLLTYEGSWAQGEHHGYGTLRAADGSYAYAGTWRKSQKHGMGMETIAGVGRFEGTFVRGRFSGSGTWTSDETASWLASGTIQGQWKDGQFVTLEHVSWPYRSIFVGLVAGMLIGMWPNLKNRCSGK